MNTISMQYRRLGLLLAAGLILLLAACGGSGGNGGSGSSGAGGAKPTEAPSTEQPKATEQTEVQDEGTLTVYLNDFDEMIGPMFEEATGYKVNLVSGNGAEIMSRIEAEKGNPHWDVVWMDAMPSIYGLGRSGQLLEGWTPDNAAHISDAMNGYVPEQKWFYPTGAHAAGVIVYNTNELTAEQAPKSWSDFTDPAYKDMIGMADPAIAAPAYPFVAYFFQSQGMDEAKTYFETLMANGLRVYPKNPNVVSALASGEIKVAALQESNAYKMKLAGEPIEIVWPEEGAPASVRVAGIQKNTKNPNAAKAFIEFLLDPKTQQALLDEGEESFFEAAAKDVAEKPERFANAKLNAAEAAWASEHEAEIKQWFADKSVK